MDPARGATQITAQFRHHSGSHRIQTGSLVPSHSSRLLEEDITGDGDKRQSPPALGAGSSLAWTERTHYSTPIQAHNNLSTILRWAYMDPLETSYRRLSCQNTAYLMTCALTMDCEATIDFLKKERKKCQPQTLELEAAEGSRV